MFPINKDRVQLIYLELVLFEVRGIIVLISAKIANISAATFDIEC